MKCQKLSTPTTIGELRKIIAKYPDNTPFGFRNQPLQDLYEVQNLKETYIVFQEK